jgi:hypothetical protein
MKDLQRLVFIFCISACAHESNLQFKSKSGEDPVCVLQSGTEITSYALPVVPKYFFKPVGISQESAGEIAFVGIDPKTQKDQNFIFNLTDKSITAIPGNLDPIGLLGTDLVSVPLDDGDGHLKMAFYDLRDFRKNGLQSTPLLPPDTSLNGRYQSLGTLPQTQGAVGLVHFRILTDGNYGGQFRDFEVDIKSIPATLRPISMTKVLCPNLRKNKKSDLNLKLPMLSKDGQFFSAFDLDQQQMKIFDLDSKNGFCREQKNRIPGRGDIGKLDFSMDSQQVAFHYSDRNLELSPLTFAKPSFTWALRSTIYDLNRQAYLLLPFGGPGTNSYYPSFLQNGHILFLQIQSEDSEVKPDTFRLIEVIPPKKNTNGWILASDLERLRTKMNQDPAPYQWISQEWLNRCTSSPGKSDPFHRLLSILSLSHEQCEGLIQRAISKLAPDLKPKVESICNNRKD